MRHFSISFQEPCWPPFVAALRESVSCTLTSTIPKKHLLQVESGSTVSHDYHDASLHQLSGELLSPSWVEAQLGEQVGSCVNNNSPGVLFASFSLFPGSGGCPRMLVLCGSTITQSFPIHALPMRRGFLQLPTTSNSLFPLSSLSTFHSFFRSFFFFTSL